MSEININNPTDGAGDFDVESAFLGIAARLQPEMTRDQQQRYQDAELMAGAVANDVEAHYESVQSAKLIAVAGLTFALGWLAGKK